VIAFTVDGQDLARAVRRLAGLRLDADSHRQGFVFVARAGGRVSILGRGRDDTFAVAKVSSALVEAPGAFTFPSASLRDIASLRGPIIFAIESDGDVHYSTESGAGFRWQPADRREVSALDPALSKAAVIGRAPAGVLGVALSRGTAFLKRMHRQGLRPMLHIRVSDDGAGFELTARTTDAELRFRAGNGHGTTVVLAAEHAAGLSTFLRGSDALVAVRTTARDAYVMDPHGNVWGWRQGTSVPWRALESNGDRTRMPCDGKALDRALGHLARAKRTAVGLRLNAGSGELVVGCRDPRGGRFVGYHGRVEIEGASPSGLVGIDLPIGELKALVAGAGTGDVYLEIDHANRAPHERALALVVRESFLLNAKGLRPSPKDPPAGIFACELERTLQIDPARKLPSAVVEAEPITGH
jgi:hypothetical protein